MALINLLNICLDSLGAGFFAQQQCLSSLSSSIIPALGRGQALVIRCADKQKPVPCGYHTGTGFFA